MLIDSMSQEENSMISDSMRLSPNSARFHSDSMLSTSNMSGDFSSIGKVLSSHTRPTFLRKMKIAPVQDETSTGLSCLNEPDAIRFIDNYINDLSIEGEKVLQMDNIVHMHTDSEDAMITSALGLITGMEMKGPIPFKNFKTTFSTAYFLKGVFNPREGDIYAMASYTVRGQHSRVTERLASWYHECKNLAFAKRHQPRNDCSDCLGASKRKVSRHSILSINVSP
ncbi:hypothetical protein TrLO_g9820 [Triparma laevis f. longispina]|uniref:Uncharacterized protein n=1 Tax=Triparma laevis f. longispina TaxID=1714387 RepID=A0A9W7FQ99_9STRA|nr:hypothetical protein TrLO_g9820 [Triparma laevis f. longispina]